MAVGLPAANVEELIAPEFHCGAVTALGVDTGALAQNHLDPFQRSLNCYLGGNVLV